MKIIFIVIVALILPLSCQEIGNDASNRESQRFEEPSVNRTRVKFHILSQNPFPIYDFIYYKGSILGATTRIGDGKRQLFDFDETEKQWRLSVIDIPKLKWEDIKAISLNKDSLWYVSQSGFVIKSEPDTNNWEIVSQVKISDPKFISFADNKVGFLVGDIFTRENLGCEIFKTEDGGRTWNKVFESKLSGNASSLEVINENEILVAMNDEYLLQTQDSGKIWNPIVFDSEITNFTEILKLDKTGAKDLTISPDGNFWVVGEKGSIYFSTDRGNSWKKPSSLPNSLNDKSKLTSIAFSPTGEGVIVGYDGLILVSYDNGLSWEDLTNDLKKDNENISLEKFMKISFTNKTFTILGVSGIYQLSF